MLAAISQGADPNAAEAGLDFLEDMLQRELMGSGPGTEIDSNLDSKDLDAAMRAVEHSFGMDAAGPALNGRL